MIGFIIFLSICQTWFATSNANKDSSKFFGATLFLNLAGGSQTPDGVLQVALLLTRSLRIQKDVVLSHR